MSWIEREPPPLEKDVQRQILDYLALRRIPAIRFNSGAMSGTYNGKRRFVRFASVAGVSDVYATLPGGRAFWCEVKRRGEKPTAKQQAFLAMQRAAGALTCVAYCVEDVVAALAAA